MPKHHKCPEHVNHERWLVSYADFITLLFAFFTVLYAISNTDSKKVEKFVGSAERAFSMGIFPSGGNSIFLSEATTSMGGGVFDMGIKMTDVEKSLNTSLEDEVKQGRVNVEKKEGGLLITLNTVGFFKPGSDSLHPQAMPVLEKIGFELKMVPNQIRVEGHTDNLPIKTERFSSNWELSSARAVAVLNGLLQTGVQAERFSVAGYAEHKPLSPNTSAEGRSKNRRVEIFVIESETKKDRYNLLDIPPQQGIVLDEPRTKENVYGTEEF